MRGLLSALTFLTIAPLPGRAWQAGDAGRAVPWFPVVGLLVGAALAGVDWGARALWDPLVAAALVIAASVLLTGGLHLDGLMDTADAFFSHGDRARMLAIMKDSRAGALGVAAAICVLLAKFAAYAHLKGPGRWQIIVAAAVLGRLGIAFGLFAFRSAKETGLGAVFVQETRGRHFALAMVMALGITFWVLRWQGLVLVGVPIVLALLAGAYASRKLGGLTGDVCGAINELAELAVLLLAPLAIHWGS